MPSASEFNIDPNLNVTIGGVNVGEDCSPAGINNAIRYLAAAARDSFNQISGAGADMPISGGTFTGDILRQNRGAYFHHANSARTGGIVDFLPEGSSRPSPVEGMVVFYY